MTIDSALPYTNWNYKGLCSGIEYCECHDKVLILHDHNPIYIVQALETGLIFHIHKKYIENVYEVNYQKPIAIKPEVVTPDNKNDSIQQSLF